MSIIPLAIYILTVSGFSNFNIANGIPVPAASTFNKTQASNGAPQQLLEHLDADWLNTFQGDIFPEVGTGNGHGDDIHTSTEATTASSLGFDFNYLFKKEHKKESKKQQWDTPQSNNQNQDNGQNNVNNGNSANNEMLNENESLFPVNDQGFGYGAGAQFDPFLNPFMPPPNFLNLRRQSYARNPGPIPIWAQRSYSNGFGFPMPQFFPPGFGRY